MATRFAQETSALDTKIEQSGTRLTALGRDISVVAASMQQQCESVAQQLKSEHAATQASIEESAAAIKRDLQHQVSQSQSSVANDFRTTMQAREEKHEAQLRLLAECADERAMVFARCLDDDRHEREHRQLGLQHEIRGCQEACSTLKGDLTSLRMFLHDKHLESSSRLNEDDRAAARDGLMGPGIIGGAAVTAAILL